MNLTEKRDEIKWIARRKIMVCRNFLTARQMKMVPRILGMKSLRKFEIMCHIFDNVESQGVRSLARSLMSFLIVMARSYGFGN